MNEKKFPEPVEALVLILAIFGFILIFAGLWAFVVQSISPGVSIEETARLLFVFGGSFFLIIPFVYVKIRKYDARKLFRLNPVSANTVALSLVIGLALSVVSDGLDRLIQVLIPMPDWLIETMQPLIAQSPSDWALNILGAVVIAGISEEILFRGFLQVTLERKGDITRAVILASLSWTLIHLNPYWAVQIFTMGIVLGYLAWRTDSVIPSIIAHALNNLISLLFVNLNLDQQWAWYLSGQQLNPVIFVVALAALVWGIRTLAANWVTE